MKNVFLILVIIFPFFVNAQDNGTKTLNEIQNVKIQDLEIKNKELLNDVLALKLENSVFKVNIENLKQQHQEQADYYKGIIDSMLNIFYIVIAIIGAAFSLFIWLFKKPEELWRKLSIIQNDASRLFDKLKSQIQHQQSLFILRKKGLYSFSFDDWNIVKNYALQSKKEKDEMRTEYDWYFMGLWEFKQKKYPMSIEYFSKATELDQNFEDALKDLGNSYEENNEPYEAIKCYEKVLEINPFSYKAYNNLGLVYSTLRTYSEARKNFEKSLSIDSSQGFTYNNIFELDLIMDKDFDSETLKSFEKSFTLDEKIYPTFEMLNVFKQITKGADVTILLKDLEDKNFKLGSDECFKEIEKWINKKEDPNLKTNLSQALMFFKSKNEVFC